MFDSDVFVLGGGPAGLACAIAARRAGLRVMLADAQRPPIDKACGEGLMPDSLVAASQIGVRIPADYGYQFRGIRFVGAEHHVAAEFPNGSGLGVRRTVLHSVLVKAAENAGVDLLWGCPATGFGPHAVVLRNKRMRARWIIGADGPQSSLRRWAGMQSFRRDSRRFSYRCHYLVAPWSEHVDIHWGDGCQFYVSPVDANEVCLVLITSDPRQRILDGLARFPIISDRLRGVECISSERGALAAIRQIRRVTKGNVALVGDASGMVDPITGEGLCLAFKQAQALANALVKGDLNLYERAHAAMARRSRFMADFMLLMDRSPLLQKRALAAFDRHPALFRNLLAMHVGQLSPVRFAATAAALGWNVATARKARRLTI